MSLSLPAKQIEKIDEVTKRYGFANRSEFFRSLLRFAFSQPHLLNQSANFPFVTPKEKSAKRIVADFKKSGKYSKDFLNDLKKGLSQSSYFSK